MMAWARVAVAVAVRPSLWPTAVRQARLLGRPSPEYLRFRMVTQYGDESHRPVPSDVVSYLEWLRSWRAVVRP